MKTKILLPAFILIGLLSSAQIIKDVAGYKAGCLIYVEKGSNSIDSVQIQVKDELLSYDLIKLTCTQLKMDFSFLHSLYFSERIEVKVDKSGDMYDTDGLFLMVYYSDSSKQRSEAFLDAHLKNWQAEAEKEHNETMRTQLAMANEDLITLRHIKDSLVKNQVIVPPNPSSKTISKTETTEMKIAETELRIANIEKRKLISIKKYLLIKKTSTEKTVIKRFI